MGESVIIWGKPGQTENPGQFNDKLVFPMGERYTPPCPHYRRCGGCQLQNLPYEEQLLHKQREAVRLLGRFGQVEQIIGMDQPLHYRNKVHAAFGLDARQPRHRPGGALPD